MVPEFELFDLGHVWALERLLGKYGLPSGGRVHVDFVMGVPGGMPGTAAALVAGVAALPAEVTSWSATGIGRSTLPVMLASLAQGGHLRVGMEDVLTIARGVPVESNAQLVARAVEAGARRAAGADDDGRDARPAGAARAPHDPAARRQGDLRRRGAGALQPGLHGRGHRGRGRRRRLAVADRRGRVVRGARAGPRRSRCRWPRPWPTCWARCSRPAGSPSARSARPGARSPRPTCCPASGSPAPRCSPRRSWATASRRWSTDWPSSSPPTSRRRRRTPPLRRRRGERPARRGGLAAPQAPRPGRRAALAGGPDGFALARGASVDLAVAPEARGAGLGRSRRRRRPLPAPGRSRPGPTATTRRRPGSPRRTTSSGPASSG